MEKSRKPLDGAAPPQARTAGQAAPAAHTLAHAIMRSPGPAAQRRLGDEINNSPRVLQAKAGLNAPHRELAILNAGIAQEEEKETLQKKSAGKPENLDSLDGPPVRMPRTKAEERLHLAAATRQLNIIAGKSKTTSEIAAHFPLVRQRYQLVQLGFVRSGDGKYAIRARINPISHIGVDNVAMDGTSLDGLKTEVKWITARLGGSVVGKKMVASRLGPDHPQGTPPASGVQSPLMNQLTTDPGETNENKYIRGHLLNDNLGGLGVATNLFPITGNANSQHAHRIEETVKKWVNINRYWVHYEVEVSSITDDLKGVGHKANNYVNATFKCAASVIHADGSKANEIKADIRSQYQQLHQIDNPAVTAIKALPKVGAGAAAAVVTLSTSKADTVYVLNSSLVELGKSIKTDSLIDDWEQFITEAVTDVKGFGPAAAEMYELAVPQGANDLASVLSDSQKATLTKLNKRWEEVKAALIGKRNELYEEVCESSYDEAKASYDICAAAADTATAKAALTEVMNAAANVQGREMEVSTVNTRHYKAEAEALVDNAEKVVKYLELVDDCRPYFNTEDALIARCRTIHEQYYGHSVELSASAMTRREAIHARDTLLPPILAGINLQKPVTIALAHRVTAIKNLPAAKDAEQKLLRDKLLARLGKHLMLSYEALDDMFKKIIAKA
jgi:hypothetical protein